MLNQFPYKIDILFSDYLTRGDTIIGVIFRDGNKYVNKYLHPKYTHRKDWGKSFWAGFMHKKAAQKYFDEIVKEIDDREFQKSFFSMTIGGTP